LKQYQNIQEYEESLANAVPASSLGALRGVLWHRCADGGLLEGEAFIQLKRGCLRPAVALRAD
jgi:hypothetical protein